MYGLLKKDFDYIFEALTEVDGIDKVIIFGSRAMGNYKRGSDVDIAIVGDNINIKTVFRLSYFLNEEYPMPYFFDVINYNMIKNERLKEHINTYGQAIMPVMKK